MMNDDPEKSAFLPRCCARRNGKDEKLKQKVGMWKVNIYLEGNGKLFAYPWCESWGTKREAKSLLTDNVIKAHQMFNQTGSSPSLFSRLNYSLSTNDDNNAPLFPFRPTRVDNESFCDHQPTALLRNSILMNINPRVFRVLSIIPPPPTKRLQCC